MADMTLHLQKEEVKIFRSLPKDLQDGWKTEEETIHAAERPEELKMRGLMLKTKAPNFETSLSALPKDLVAEALFAMGTEGLSGCIGLLLSHAKTDDDLKGIAELANLRHALLESNAAHAPAPSR